MDKQAVGFQLNEIVGNNKPTERGFDFACTIDIILPVNEKFKLGSEFATVYCVSAINLSTISVRLVDLECLWDGDYSVLVDGICTIVNSIGLTHKIVLWTESVLFGDDVIGVISQLNFAE